MMIHSSSVTFFALMLSAVAVSVLLARHGRSMGWLERLGLVALAVYVPIVLGQTLGDIPVGIDAAVGSEWRNWANLVPFRTIGPQLAAGQHSGLRQIVGNLLILAPLGFILPIGWHRFRRSGSLLLAGLAAALGVEVSQLVIGLVIGVPYRAFDVDDLILNTAGAIVGWTAWRLTIGSRSPFRSAR